MAGVSLVAIFQVVLLVAISSTIWYMKSITISGTPPMQNHNHPSFFNQPAVAVGGDDNSTQVNGGVPSSLPNLFLQEQVKIVKPQVQLQCQWMLITGDSNSRFPYWKWGKLEKNGNQNIVVEAQWSRIPNTTEEDKVSCQGPHNTGEWRWADSEMVLRNKVDGSCRIVTLKFLKNQKSEVDRLSNLTAHSSAFCPGYQLSNVIPDGFQRPTLPDTIWFSHGIWALPNGGGSAGNLDLLNCTERFEPHLKKLLAWKQGGVPSITWQTLFPINGHPSTTNTYLQWDYECQKEMAQKHGLTENLFDMYQLVEPMVDLQRNDYHFKDSKEEMVVESYLAKCCGGWGDYRNETKRSPTTDRPKKPQLSNPQWFQTSNAQYQSFLSRNEDMGVDTEGVHSHLLAGMFCNWHHLFLCSYNEYCPTGQGSNPYRGGPNNASWNALDSSEEVQWAPMFTKETNPKTSEAGGHWVQVGTIPESDEGNRDHDYGKCRTWDEWTKGLGENIEVKWGEGHRRWILCCEKKKQEERYGDGR